MKRLVVLALIFSLGVAAAVFTVERAEDVSKRVVQQLSPTFAGPSNK